jgi:hypothetical protein
MTHQERLKREVAQHGPCIRCVQPYVACSDDGMPQLFPVSDLRGGKHVTPQGRMCDSHFDEFTRVKR